MKKSASLFTVLCSVSLFIILTIGGAGCANMIPPGGGPRDTLPPILVAETPVDSATNIAPKRITFVFNEYVELDNAQQNVLFSPVPKNTPIVEARLRTITVRLRDTLDPNTTYAINFGNAIKDLNEGNIFKDFYYVFSTGSRIDTFSLSGNVTLAETGKADSTLIAILHRNVTSDSAVVKETPRYIARLDAQGNFTFRNLPAGTFALYAVTNNYGYRFDEREPFAFADKPLTIGANNAPVNLFAYVESPRQPTNTGGTAAPAKPKANQKDPLRYTTNIQGGLDILGPLNLTFNRRVTAFDSTKVALTTPEFAPLRGYTITADTTGFIFSINYPWKLGTPYHLVMDKTAFADSVGTTLAKNDTLRFNTKGEEDYGSVRLRFNNLDTAKHPVLLLVQSDKIVLSAPLTQRDWTKKLIEPGEYEIRILFDANRNGKWDAGKFFGEHRQPEIVQFINTKLTIRGNWENEKDITLTP